MLKTNQLNITIRRWLRVSRTTSDPLVKESAYQRAEQLQHLRGDSVLTRPGDTPQPLIN